ncbi:hypothetical protein ACT691_18810 [Vibrio metschnikovii]
MGKWLLWFGLFSLPAQAVHEVFVTVSQLPITLYRACLNGKKVTSG